MSSIWRQGPDGTWEATPLADGVDADAVRLVPLEKSAGSSAGLLAPVGLPVHVNGQPVPSGFVVLDHRDEVLIGTERYFFSSQSVPVPSVFQLEEGERPPTCPVCRGPLRAGDRAVRCPGCGRWFHQIDAGEEQRAKHCWTHAPTCHFCNHPTALSEEAVWRPEKEDVHA